jgi:hypothetical protein
MNKLGSYLSVIVLSAVGMVLGHYVGSRLAWSTTSAVAQTTSAVSVVSTRTLEVVGADGRRQLVMGTGTEGSPGIWIYDRNGKVRLSLGLYGDNNASIVLNDESEQAVEIFRTVGPHSVPVLVMKAQGRDRIVMGLDGPGQDPFLVLYGTDGAKQRVFGNY